MPPQRTFPSRRSRRLSKQDPLEPYAEEPWEYCNLVYPDLGPHSDYTTASPATDSSFAPSPQSYSSPPPSSVPASARQNSVRSSHSRRRPDDHVPRPPNAFILFRSDFWASEKFKEVPVEKDHRNVSRIVGHMWQILDEETKMEYKRLAVEKKRQHHIDHPNYKYAPVSRKSKPATRKSKETNQDEEKCRKLASLLMGGVQGAGLKVAMAKLDKVHESDPIPSPSKSTSRPRHCASGTSRHQAAHARRAPKQASPEAKLESPYTPALSFNSSETHADEGFVALEDIPPLNLNEPWVKKESKSEEELNLSLRPPSYHDVGEQFGFKPELSQFAPESCFWYTSDGMIITGTESSSSSMAWDASSELFAGYSCSPADSIIDFTNPFAPTDSSGATYAEHEMPFSTEPVSPTSFASTDLGANYDSDMNQYFRFDTYL